jgi:uncharacterized paraquat-inducible protein A
MSKNTINCKNCRTKLTLPFIAEGRLGLCFSCFGKIEKSRRRELFAHHETNEIRPDGQIG